MLRLWDKNGYSPSRSFKSCGLKEKKKKILPLFPSLDHHVTIEAVIEETCEGKILVDDTKTPKTAAVWTAPVSEAAVYLGFF